MLENVCQGGVGSPTDYGDVRSELLEEMLSDAEQRDADVALELASRLCREGDERRAAEYLNKAVDLAASPKEANKIALRFREWREAMRAGEASRGKSILAELPPPLLAAARMGDEESISKCVDRIEGEPDLDEKILGIRRASYVRQRSIVALMKKYLFSDDCTGGKGNVLRSYVSHKAALSLSEMLVGFPERNMSESWDTYVERCRRWISAEREWTLIK